jgi:AraC family transcriptional regulator
MPPPRIAIVPGPVLDRAAEGYAKTQPSVQQLDDAAFATVIAYIDGHLSQRITTRDLSGLVGISRHHFGRRFKMKAGMSPYAFITKCRMEMAKRLLMETDLSHEQIAAQVGFAHTGHFRRQFRKQFGTNPSHVRESVVTGECGVARAKR